MSKLLALVVGIALAGLVVWAPDVQSQAPEPVGPLVTITGCNGPDRDQVDTFKMECELLRIGARCKVGTVHPVQTEPSFCLICLGNIPTYCEKWGCFLHACPRE